jgi:hypothetical protein
VPAAIDVVVSVDACAAAFECFCMQELKCVFEYVDVRSHVCVVIDVLSLYDVCVRA